MFVLILWWIKVLLTMSNTTRFFNFSLFSFGSLNIKGTCLHSIKRVSQTNLHKLLHLLVRLLINLRTAHITTGTLFFTFCTSLPPGASLLFQFLPFQILNHSIRRRSLLLNIYTFDLRSNNGTRWTRTNPLIPRLSILINSVTYGGLSELSPLWEWVNVMLLSVRDLLVWFEFLVIAIVDW